MATSHQPQAQQVAAFISEQWVYTASALLAMHLGIEHPGLRQSFEQAAAEERPALENVYFKRRDGTERMVPFLSSIAFPLRRYRSREDFERAIMMGMISLAAAALDDHNYFDRAPVLEFVRHLRNGISHGNTFFFTGNAPNPKYPARFRSFMITRALMGQRVLFDYLYPGDAFDLFNEVERIYILFHDHNYSVSQAGAHCGFAIVLTGQNHPTEHFFR